MRLPYCWALTVMVLIGMQKLRLWRETLGKSQAEAGAAVGCSGVQWHRLETGKRPITAEMAVKIEKATGIRRVELRADIFGPVGMESVK